jgi:hypothetical protein
MAQQQPTFNGWLMYLNSTKLNKKFSLHFDAQLRSNAQVKHLQTLIVRPGSISRLNGILPQHWDML